MYHTQEQREVTLAAPKMCTKSDAWLGEAFYFWDDRWDAEKWGHDFKYKTGKLSTKTSLCSKLGLN